MHTRGAQPWQTNRARVLRSELTAAEAKLWQELRGRRLGGFKFVRQSPVEQFYSDFCCREQKLIVEIDGGTHSTAAEINTDAVRTRILDQSGYRVFRVHNSEVFENLDGVLTSLLEALNEKGK
jgi:very-short-patch-repair endonuclease